MDRKDFMVWLRKRGFNRPTFDVYESEYEAETVRVEVGRTSARTLIVTRGVERALRAYSLSDLTIDGHGMINGAGLTSFFVERMNFGAPTPKWFNAAFRNTAKVRLELEARLTMSGEWPEIKVGARQSRGGPVMSGSDGRKQVTSWLLDHGFRQVGFNAFEAYHQSPPQEVITSKVRQSGGSPIDVDPDRVRVFLTDYGIQTSRVATTPIGIDGFSAEATTRITSGLKLVLGSGYFGSLRIDPFGMLRGASLVTPFISDIYDGGVVPTWFTPKFVSACGLEQDAVANFQPHLSRARVPRAMSF